MTNKPQRRIRREAIIGTGTKAFAQILLRLPEVSELAQLIKKESKKLSLI